MPKKVYLHYEKPNGGGTVTIPVAIGDETTVTEVLEKFADTLSKSTPVVQIFSSFILKTSDGKVLLNSKRYNFSDLTEDSDDMFVTDKPTSPTAFAVPSPVVSKPVIVEAAKITMDTKEIKEQRLKVKSFIEKRSFKKAREICERMFTETIPDSEIVFFYKAMAEINYINKNYTKGLAFCKKGLAKNATSVELLFLKARCLFCLKEFDDANDVTDILKDLVPATPSKATPPSTSVMTPNGKKVTGSGSDIPKSICLLDVLALEAECVFEGGSHNDGANLINKAMSYTGADNHLSVLLAYANFCLRYNKVEDALRALLKAITVSQSDKRVKLMLFQALKDSQGVTELQAQLPCSAASASAYAYMATIVKEHSALNSAIELYRLCTKAVPSSGSYALNLMHTTELTCAYHEAIAAFVTFARANANSSTTGNRVIPLLGQLLDIVTDTNPKPEMCITYIVDPKIDTNSHVQVLPKSEDGVLDLTGAIDTKAIEKWHFNEAECDLMAIACTVAKILYLQGKLSTLPLVYQAVERFRVKSLIAWHETMIRNEVAYYQTIGQILCLGGGNDHVVLRDPVIPTKANKAPAPLFICGDSHTLSPAWSSITVKGVKRLIVPKLATGVKQWHLRADSDFYPKANFHNVVGTIPDGSEVIFVIGEIDCREGMLVAVERDYYESLPEAMEVTINLFVKEVLSVLVKKKKLKIYVHPIVPVMDATRHLVVAYNKIFQKATANIPGVVWLDFFDGMLTGPVAPMLQDKYKMDGTHLHPVYVELIQEAFNAL